MSRNSSYYNWAIAIGVICIAVYFVNYRNDFSGIYSGDYDKQSVTLDFRKNGTVYIFVENTFAANAMKNKFNIEHFGQKIDSGKYAIDGEKIVMTKGDKRFELSIEQKQIVMGAYRFFKKND